MTKELNLEARIAAVEAAVNDLSDAVAEWPADSYFDALEIAITEALFEIAAPGRREAVGTAIAERIAMRTGELANAKKLAFGFVQDLQREAGRIGLNLRDRFAGRPGWRRFRRPE